MLRRTAIIWTVSAAVVLSIWAPAPANGAGFGIFEQGAKAMGLAGAFTGQADDPSALFHNAGGLAFLKERDISVGTTLIALGSSKFTGELPFPGPTATGEQKDQVVFPSHVYYVQPINQSWTFGIGLNSPFGLVTEWDNPDDWVGRFLSTRAELRTFDLNPSLGWQVTPKLGIGFGVVARFSDVVLDRRAATIVPGTFSAVEVAKVRLESDLDEGYGWNVGLLHRYNNSFSWGISYRSAIKIDYGGDARLTQVPTGSPLLDALVAASLPFNQALPIETSVEYPELASLGFSFALSPNLRLNTDFNWTGWSSFDRIDIVFRDNPQLSETLPENWDDANNYRVGLAWNSGPTSQWRLGYVYDETPQPDETVSPLLPDANRDGYTVGYGYNGGFTFDVAFMYLIFDERTTTTNVDNFNGTYDTEAYLLGMTFTW
jgi:long-chain fatty acid transport protein